MKRRHLQIQTWLMLVATGTVLFNSGCATVETADLEVPQPRLVLRAVQGPDETGTHFARYSFSVENWSIFPEELFESAPDLPPCGRIANAARACVEILNAKDGSLMSRFCALSSRERMTYLWFSVREGQAAPGAVYLVLKDRRTGIDYKSNTVKLPGKVAP